jgi:hypothetical protein
MGFYSGVFNTTVNPTELNKRSFASTLLRLFPDGATPIFALTSQTGRSRAVSSTHGYFTKTLTFGSVQINAGAGYAAGITVFTVDSSVGILAGMVLYVAATRENIRVASVDSATQITVVRSFGRVTATGTIADNAVLPVIGSAYPEGSDRPVARGLTTVYVPNYTQIFRDAWALTDTARASMTEMGFTNIAENRRDCGLLHAVSIESAILFGQPKMDTTGTQPLHATQGVIDATEQYAPGNTNTAAATTNYTQLIALFEPAWTYSHDLGDSKKRMCFAGATALKVFNDIARLNGTVQIMQGQTSFGMQYTTFLFYKGTVVMLEHPLLNGISGMAGLAVGIDMPALKLAYMDGRDTRSEEYGGGRNQTYGIDADGGSLTTELAVEDLNPAGNFVIYGLTAGAAG